MLRRFEAQLQTDVPRIWRAISQDHTEEALSLTRTVKAGAAQACAEPTRDAANTVERALTTRDMESAIVAAGELRAEADRFQAYMPTVQATLSGHHDDGLRQRSHTDNNE